MRPKHRMSPGCLLRTVRVLVCSVAAISTLIASSASAQVLSAKRGFADVGASYQYLQTTGAGWYYTWGLGPANPGSFDAKWAPMFWGGWQVTQGNIDWVNSFFDVEWVLGFNEPERSDQANMTVSQAIAAWRTLSAGFSGTGKKLVTPAVSDTSAGKAWMQDFHTQAVAEGLKVDAVAFHWYGWSTPSNPAQAASNFIGSMNWYHNLWGKPVFCTEFAIHDWGGSQDVDAMIEANRQFLDIVVPWLESTSWVAGYAMYPWFSDAPLWQGSPPVPSPMGYEYIGVIETSENYDIARTNHREHVAYLAGGQLTYGGGPGTALKYINALEGRSIVRGAYDWGLQPGGWIRVQPGATLRKADLTGLAVIGGSISNNGVIEIDDGTLQVGGPVSGSGRMTIGTYGNGTVARLEISGDTSIGNDIGFRGRHTGTPAIVNASGDNVISGSMTIEVGGADYIIQSDAGSLDLIAPLAIDGPAGMGDRLVTLAGAADGRVRGVIENQSGTTVSIAKTGAGTWTLEGENAYDGLTTISEGTLVLNGRGGAGQTVVGPDATLAGGGTLPGDLTTSAGATLRVGHDGLMLVSPSLLGPIDGFDLYPAGAIGAVPNTTGDVWTGVFDGTGNAEVVDNAGDHALRVHGIGNLDWRGAICDLTSHPAGDASLADGDTGTYFFRLRRNGTGTIYAVLGLSDEPASINAPPGNDTATPYDEYAVTLTLVGNQLNSWIRAYSEGSGDIALQQAPDGEWINVWVIVDNASKTFRVATSTGLDDGTDSGGVYNFGRRTGATVGASPLVTFGIHEGRNVYVELDDLSFVPGEDLYNPLSAEVLAGETLTVEGSVTQIPTSSMRLDIADPATHDKLVVGGSFFPGGDLEVALDPAATPVAGDTFDLLDFGGVLGSFANVSMPGLPGGLAWDTSSLLTDGTVTVIAGGCNAADLNPPYGVLDLTDITAFIAAFSAQSPAGDIDGNGIFDLVDISTFIAAFTAGCP